MKYYFKDDPSNIKEFIKPVDSLIIAAQDILELEEMQTPGTLVIIDNNGGINEFEFAVETVTRCMLESWKRVNANSTKVQ